MPSTDSHDDDEEDHDDDNEDDEEEDDDELLNPLLLLPDYVVKRVDKLKELDGSRDTIMDQYNAERAALEQRYAGLLKPIYQEREDIVKGTQDEAIAKASGSSPDKEVKEGEVAVKGVPHFWLTAISNHETVGELITENDVACMEHLEDIFCIDDEDGKGFVLHFKFGPNDFFSDTVLTKKYQVPNLMLSDEPMIKQVEGCTINWKGDDHCLTFRRFEKKQRGKGKRAGQVRTIIKKEKTESFFHFFEPPKMPKDVEGMDEDEVEEIEELFSDDFDVAQAFRGEICPRAVLWYTGEASEKEMAEMIGSPDGAQEENGEA